MIRVALAQLDLTVGALAANADRIADACADARRQGAELVLAPELAISGYPPEDLLFRPAFLDACRHEAERLAERVEVPLLVGCPWLDGDRVRNSALLLRRGGDRGALRQAGAAELRRLRRGADVRRRAAAR